MVVLETLAAAGVKEFGGYVFKEVFMPLVKGSLEDYTKDVFKGCITDFAGLTTKEPLEKAAVQGLKIFLELFENELLEWDVTPAEVRDLYQIPIKQFVHSKEVKTVLGEAFKINCKAIDTEALAMAWKIQAKRDLPEDFDWERIGKKYVKRVQQGLLIEIPELRSIIEMQNQQAIRQSMEAIAGIPVNFNLKEYQEALREKFGSIKLESLDTTGSAYNSLRLWNIFVPQSVRECQEFTPQLYELPKEKLLQLQAQGEIEALLELEAIERHRKTYVERPIEPVLEVVGLKTSTPLAVILGDPGSGKSTLLQYLALNWAEKPLAELKGQPIPILIELRTYARDKQAQKCNDFLGYFHQGNTLCQLNHKDLHELFEAGNAIALFDGVDEVFDPVLREEVVNDIHKFSNRYPSVQIVATSRWLGYKAETLRNAGFKHFMLQDLDDGQIEDFIQRWHELTFEAQAADKARKQERLQKAIRESKPIRELAGNPLLLTMMAILNRNQELPRDRARLYERASEVLLYQWDVEAKLLENEQLKTWSIDVRDKQAMLRKVAYHMQAGKKGLAGNIISREDLEKILTDYLKTIEVDQARAVARLMIEQLRERNFILCLLGADSYAFVHRTFLEYFCAWEFVWQFEKDQKITIEDLKQEVYGKHFQDEAWDEVLRLIAGMIEPHFVGEIIEALLDQKVDRQQFLTGADRLQRLGLSNLLLAADCLKEVRSRNELSFAENQLLKALQKEVDLEYPYWLEEEAAKAISSNIADLWKHTSQIKTWLKCYLDLNSLSYFPEASISSIAQVWKSDPDTLPWLKARVQSDDNEYVRSAAVQALAQGWKDDSDTLSILKACAETDDDNDVRSAAVQAVVQSWKGDPDTLSWLKDRAQSGDDGAVRSAAVQALAQSWKDDPDTLSILKACAETDDNGYVRRVAVQALAQGWKDDPDTLSWLKDRAQSDDNGAVRSAAVQALAQGWKDDPDTLSWLKDCAQSDDDNDVRSAAVQALAQGWKDDPDTLSILKACAETDDNGYVRRVAVQALAQGWKDDPDTLNILKNHAQTDDDSDVRSVAVQALAQSWKDDPDTLSILKDRAQSDDNEYVRRAAVQALAQSWKDDPDTLSILKDRAQSDDNGYVRRAAVQALAQGWKDDPDTLSWLKACAETDDDNDVRRAAVQALAKGWKDDPDTLSWLKACAQSGDNGAVRSVAVQALAKGWKDDPDTLSWLKACAQSGGNGAVRSAAIQELAQGWKDDPDTLNILKNRAQTDDDNDVRSIAVQALAQGWKDDPDTLNILKDRAQSDDNGYVRRAAVQALAQGWKDDPDTLNVLKDRVQSDDDSDFRSAAVQALAKGWKDDPDTLNILKDRAQSDNNWAVRRAAIQALAKGWKGDPSLFEIWCDFSQNHPFKRSQGYLGSVETNPRQIALKVLTQQYPKHPKTYELLADRAEHDSDEQLRKWARKEIKRLEG